MHNLTDNLATVFSGNRVANIEHRVSQLGNLCSCVDQFSAHGCSIKKPALFRRQGRLLGGSVFCFAVASCEFWPVRSPILVKRLARNYPASKFFNFDALHSWNWSNPAYPLINIGWGNGKHGCESLLIPNNLASFDDLR